MAGETNLATLLASMSPQLMADEYVFCTVENTDGNYQALQPLATFREAEGLTLVVTKQMAVTHALAFESVFKAITLTVHSSLDAVGLTATVATKLAEKDISANVIAAYYHDHIFVQVDKAGQAMLALAEFSQ
ncbi:ACT domain-containing protein [Alginatibacterium sediminis]|uniref:ACT domain-containing protein n=1 Tax=Alginatibacterium sediminis TaxID=2164068 RepID=A0A420E9E9_9ALTE|nr:ACT domain-containing protein [Alginatibacterium sediminis]RKF17389.1 ACT domain-containing protein [Alginatibacterium sediminis]